MASFRYSLLDSKSKSDLPRRRAPDEGDGERPSRKREGFAIGLLTCINLVIFGLSTIMFCSSRHTDPPPIINEELRRNENLKAVSSYSPVLDEIDIPMTMKRVNGSFFDEPPSIWRGDPSAEVDAAWESLIDMDLVSLTADEVRKMGGDPSTSVRVPTSWRKAAGDSDSGERYIAQLDFTHQMHCLNSIRKSLWHDTYYTGEQKDRFYWGHMKHCLHVILQSLTCAADTDLILWNWVATQSQPFPDFNINRKCRDHTTVLEWLKQKKIPDLTSRWGELHPDEEDVVLPISDKVYWYFNQEPPSEKRHDS